jgi:type IX secretion system PorP/SprF family membrane protein
MKKKFGSFHKFILFQLLIVMPFSISAQQTNKNDSLKNGKHCLFFYDKTDTNQWVAPHLSEIMFNHFNENPGFCGFTQTFNYNTAINIDKPFYQLTESGYHPCSFYTSFEFSAGKKRKSGFGSCFYQLKEGPRIKDIINNSYSYRIRLGKYNNLRIGASLNIFYNSFDSQFLTFDDMIDPMDGYVWNTNETNINHTTAITWNFNAGVFFSRKLFYFGFSALNLFKPLKNSHPEYYFFKHIDKTMAQFVFSSGYTFVLSPKVALTPSAQLRIIDKETTADLHLTGVFWKHFIAGVSLNKLTTLSADLGCSFWNVMTFYVSGGISTDSELCNHFGSLDYISANLRIQLGNYQEKF